MSKLRYIAGRLVRSVILLFLVLTFLFFFFRLLPGDYTDLLIYSGATEEEVAVLEAKWGLDQPIYIQYVDYITNFLTLDAGTSFRFRVPVVDYAAPRIFNSFVLIAPGITFAYILGIIFGTGLGRARGSKAEKYGIIPILMTGTFPSFFTSILLVVIFAGILGWFPTSGMLTAGSAAAGLDRYLSTDFLWHYILPFTAVVLRYLFLPTLMMRTNVIEVSGQDFTYYHRLTGLSRLKRARHIAKHSILPIVTMYPLSLTRAIGGLVLIETVFNWPGIGNALVQGVLARDFPLVQFIFFLIAVFIVFSNLIVDLVYGVIDPRVSLEGDEG
ncbi:MULTISPECIES: ABC transporter permease [Salinibaculum]|uniref:ABC transporter permease n=1 Tax=Salinibaculum TaxID=2732368 RepID=UPI0030D60BFA